VRRIEEFAAPREETVLDRLGAHGRAAVPMRDAPATSEATTHAVNRGLAAPSGSTA